VSAPRFLLTTGPLGPRYVKVDDIHRFDGFVYPPRDGEDDRGPKTTADGKPMRSGVVCFDPKSPSGIRGYPCAETAEELIAEIGRLG